MLFKFLAHVCTWGAVLCASDFSFTHPEVTKKKHYSSGLFFKGYSYVSSKEWIVWVNDLKLFPSSLMGEVKVLEALPNNVTFEWNNLGKTVVVTLSPGDNYEQPH